MSKASRVMYSIANFFTWVIVVICIAGIVFSIIGMLGKMPEGFDPQLVKTFGVGSLVAYIFILIVSLITILMVRRAKTEGTSKGWDILFLILGIIGGNIFYILGGIFGLVARK